MRLVNLCPHPVVLLTDQGRLRLPQDGVPARLEDANPVDLPGPVPIRVVQTVGCELPPPSPGTVYIVSTFVRLANLDRGDLASPAELVKNARGYTVACRRLHVNALPS